jgi:hypothetical protein
VPYQWLRESFAKKEKLLHDFYNVSTTATASESSDAEAYRQAQAALVRDTWPKEVAHFPPSTKESHFAVCLISALMVAVSLCLWYSWMARWASAVAMIVFVSSKMFNGFDNLELTLHLNHFVTRDVGGEDKKSI